MGSQVHSKVVILEINNKNEDYNNSSDKIDLYKNSYKKKIVQISD